MRLDHLLSKEKGRVGTLHCCLSAGKVADPEEIRGLGVVIRNGVTPVPIPNTTVKTAAAESTLP